MNRSARLAARRRQILELPRRARVRAILESDRPRELVRALPAQEFFLTIAEAGLDEALPLLPLASRHQLDFLTDIDAWSGSELDPERMARWIEAFAAADPDLVARWLREGDEDTVVVALAHLVRVYKLDAETDPAFFPPERPLPTLDGVYFLEPAPGAPPEVFPPLWEGLTRLRAAEPRVYEALLEQVLWIIPAEREEEAYRGRCSRLAERGFPEFDEAVEVWVPGPEIRAEERRRLAARFEGRRLTPPAGREPVTALIPLDGSTTPVLARAVAALPPERLEETATAIAALANRYAVASLGHLGELETHRLGLETALSHLQLGLLELVPDGDAGRAAAVLAEMHPRDIARVGVGAVQERAFRARRLADGWLSRVHRGRNRLDPELDEPLTALLLPRPLFGEFGGSPRPFRTREDLEAVDLVLDTVTALGEFLEGVLGAGEEELPELIRLPAGRIGPDAVEWSAVALTAVARRVLGGGSVRPRPLSAGEARRAAAALLDGDRPGPVFFRVLDELRLGPAALYLARRLGDDADALRTAPSPRGVRSILLTGR
ncbi:MAG: hypothetical protein D6718_12720 [Acidobacteria bacterium]|nr:MAG: hypothetical protein D6718_12720 [Acidobacteriota bacterium]